MIFLDDRSKSMNFHLTLAFNFFIMILIRGLRHDIIEDSRIVSEPFFV